MYVPFLAVKEKRKDILPDPSKVDEKLAEELPKHLKIVLKGEPIKPVNPSTFFLEGIAVSSTENLSLYNKFAKYYALLSRPVVTEIYDVPSSMRVVTYLSLKRPFEKLKLYYQDVSKGIVKIKEKELVAMSYLYSEILEWLDRISERSKNLEWTRAVVNRALPSKSVKGYTHVKKLISTSGIEDGRKRILYYWLIPYWVTVEGLSVEETLLRAKEWLSRQSGGKIYESWIRAEIMNVRAKGIKPWSVEKVRKTDPTFIRYLEERGLI